MTRPFFIYALVDPRSGEIRYVGKTVVSLKARRSNHEYKARSRRSRMPVSSWIRELHRHRLRPEVRLLEELRAGRWQDAERRWIARLRKSGSNLLNAHDGGNGAHTRASLAPRFVKMLGKVSDGQVATLAGLCRETITYHRRRLGIERAPFDETRRRGTFEKGQVAHNKVELSEETISKLGKVADRVLAREAGVTRQVIRTRRKELGIAPIGTPPIERSLRGERHPNAKLTAALVEEMRLFRSRGASLRALAEHYGIDKTTVHRIVIGESWREG